MKVAFLHSEKLRERKLAKAFVSGVNSCGDHGRAILLEGDTPVPAGFDAVVMVGVKSRKIYRANVDNGAHVVMIDKGYSRHRLPGSRIWEYWRVAVDAHHPTLRVMDRRDTARAMAQGMELAPWRRRGKHIILAGSSDKYHEFYGLEDPTTYAKRIVARLRELTDRPIVYRPKPSWQGAVPIEGTIWSGGDERITATLKGAWALVTHGSNACYEAITAGVPCIVLGDGVALPISSRRLDDIKRPILASETDRRRWICGLSYCQWTEQEFASGAAWKVIRGQIA